MKMRKLVAMLMAVMMLLCIIPFSAAAESNSATIDFTDKANRVSYTTEQQVWAQNGITVTNDKGASTSNVGDYGGEGYPARFYKSSTVTIEYPGMTHIVIDCGDLEAKYINGWKDSVSAGADAGVSGSYVVITLAKAADSFTWETLTAQSRAYKIVAYSLEEGDFPVIPDAPVNPDPDTPVTPGNPAVGDVVDAPVAGTAYKFGMVQGNVSATDVYYLIGGMAQTYYLATGTDVNAAIDVYLEETDGGYYCYALVHGTKSYINMVVSADGAHVNGAYEAAPSTVYTYDTDAKTIIANVNDVPYWFGTRNDKNYTTVGPCATEYQGFYCQFYTAEGGQGGDTPVVPDPPVDPPVGDYATITFDDVSKRTEQDTEHQVWTENGIVVINNKGESTSNVANYVKPARFYKGSELIVQYSGMTSIVFHCNTAAYATALADAIGVAADGQDVTVVLKNEDSFSCSLTVGQVRIDSIDVYSKGGAPVTPPDTPVVPPVDPPVNPPVGAYATITFDDVSKRTEQDTEHQVWTENGIVVINNKGESTSNVANYVKPARFYKGSELIVQYSGMTSIVFHCNTAAYATALATVAGVEADGKDVTVAVNGVDSYSVVLTAGQVRIDSIDVYGEGGAPITPPDTPVDPDDDPEADTELSIADAIALGASKEHNTYTAGKYYVTGVITEVYNDMYGNMKLTDEDGNILTIYGTYSADGEVRYDALEVKPVAGDTVTIYGIVGQYNGAPQIKNGWIVEHIPGEGPVEPPMGDISEPVVNPVAGVPYHLGLYQTAKGAVYYFTGAMSSFYGATATDTAAAVTVYLEDAEDGYKMYFRDDSGAKMYIKLEQSGTHYNFTFGAEGSVFTLDTELNALCAPCGDQICYMGTYGNYVTIGCLTTEKLSETDYIARLYAAPGDTPVVPPVEYVGSIVASTAEGSVGNTVNVTVSLTNNPGLISAKVKVLYDSAVLKLVGYEAGNFAAGGYSWGDKDKADGSFIINWCDAINPDSTADLLAILTFEVLEGAADGFTPITLQFDCDGDMFNAAGDTIWFDAVGGGVEIVTKSYTLGDLDENGRINNRDLGMLQQHINEWPVNINTDAADLDANGRINNRDLGMLQQYINEWDVEFG